MRPPPNDDALADGTAQGTRTNEITDDADSSEAPVDVASVLRRVAKLLAIASDERADANEAAAAAGMAERVMRRFQIEHADVIEAELLRAGDGAFGDEYCGTSLNPETSSERRSGWTGNISIGVAELYGCQSRIRWTPQYGTSIRFSGYAADAAMARATYIYLVQTMAAASRAFLKADPRRRRCDATAFRLGFSIAIDRALAKELAAKTAEMQATPQSRSLMLVKAKAVADHFGEARHGTSGCGRLQGEGFGDGYRAGSNVSLGPRKAIGMTRRISSA